MKSAGAFKKRCVFKHWWPVVTSCTQASLKIDGESDFGRVSMVLASRCQNETWEGVARRTLVQEGVARAGRPWMRNRRPTTTNQQTIDNQRPTCDNPQATAGDRQATTDHPQLATDSRRPTADDDNSSTEDRQPEPTTDNQSYRPAWLRGCELSLISVMSLPRHPQA